MELPLVSIIIPVYNSSHFIEEGIKSLLQQTYQNFEIIIVDDKSTDNTVNFIKKNYSEEARIKIIEKEKNSGPANSRNIGIKNAIGKYIALLDSDDYYASTKLEKQIQFMEKNTNIIVCSTYLQCFGLQNNIVKFPISGLEIKNQQLLGCPVAHPAAIFRASFLQEHHLFYNENYRYSEDYELFTRMLEYENAEFATIPEPLYYYRISGNQASFSKEGNKVHINEEQWNVTKKIHYKVLSKLINEKSEFYNEEWVEIFLGHQTIHKYKDIKPFIQWVEKLIKYNEENGQPFSSEFLVKISKIRITGYFLSLEKLSWKILYQYISVYNQSVKLESVYRFKYIVKCLFFLKH